MPSSQYKLQLLFILLFCTAFAPLTPPKKKPESYLMAFYLGDGRTGLHLAWSENGLNWQPLRKGKSFVRPGIGDYVMREPHLLSGPDGFYHLVWSTGVSRLEIGYTRSKDLISWEPQRVIAIKDLGEDALACVSPELFYDEYKQHFMLYWSAEMSQQQLTNKNEDEDEFDAPEKTGKPIVKAEKRYLAFKKTTTDFMQFSKSESFFQPSISIRDLHLVKDSLRYILLYRDETAKPKNIQRNLKLSTSTYIDGPYSEPSASISGKNVIFSPVVYKTDSLWMILAERYKEGKIGAYATKDFLQFEDYTDSIKYSKGMRPASVIMVPNKLLKKLREME
jgi:hypothetical protein